MYKSKEELCEFCRGLPSRKTGHNCPCECHQKSDTKYYLFKKVKDGWLNSHYELKRAYKVDIDSPQSNTIHLSDGDILKVNGEINI